MIFTCIASFLALIPQVVGPTLPASGTNLTSVVATVPSNPSGGGCPAGNTELYCTAKVDQQGCTPVIEDSGCLSQTAGSGYIVQVNRTTNIKTVAQLLYSTFGGATSPLPGGGFLCLRAPIQHTTPMEQGGVVGIPCTGSFSTDFNTFIASGVDPMLVAGNQVWMQYWYLDPDPGDVNSIGLSRAITGFIGF